MTSVSESAENHQSHSNQSCQPLRAKPLSYLDTFNAQKWAFQNFAWKAWLEEKEAKEDNENVGAITSLLGQNYSSLS